MKTFLFKSLILALCLLAGAVIGTAQSNRESHRSGGHSAELGPLPDVSVTDTGTNGANGTDGNPGTTGGNGGPANANATSADASNDATANGGTGGNGGNGNVSGRQRRQWWQRWRGRRDGIEYRCVCSGRL